MALKSQHIVWELEWVWLHSCGRTYSNHTHSITSLKNSQGAFQITTKLEGQSERLISEIVIEWVWFK